MTIQIQRPPISNSKSTISKLFINGEYFCDTIEDRDRNLKSSDTLGYIKNVKVKHETAIPYGTYQLVMSYSQRFEKYLPELLNVPGFDGIRIHPGNTELDSSGCILPGVKDTDKVVNSRLTMQKLQTKINSVIKKEKIFVVITTSTI
jgi:hypothetical protein